MKIQINKTRNKMFANITLNGVTMKHHYTTEATEDIKPQPYIDGHQEIIALIEKSYKKQMALELSKSEKEEISTAISDFQAN